MTNIDKLSALLGSSHAVAVAAGVSPQLVSRWKTTRAKGGFNGAIPTKYNVEILLYCREHIPCAVMADEFMNAVMDCLDNECPCCGRAY